MDGQEGRIQPYFLVTDRNVLELGRSWLAHPVLRVQGRAAYPPAPHRIPQAGWVGRGVGKQCPCWGERGGLLALS